MPKWVLTFDETDQKRIQKWRAFKSLVKSYPKKYKIVWERDERAFSGVSKTAVLYKWDDNTCTHQRLEFQGGVVCTTNVPGWEYLDRTSNIDLEEG